MMMMIVTYDDDDAIAMIVTESNQLKSRCCLYLTFLMYICLFIVKIYMHVCVYICALCMSVRIPLASGSMEGKVTSLHISNRPTNRLAFSSSGFLLSTS